MADKDKLRNMLDNLVNDNKEQAQVDFHDYLGDKMKDTLGLNSQEVDDDAAAETETE